LRELEVRDEEDKMLMEEARRRGQRRAERAEQLEERAEKTDSILPTPVGQEEIEKDGKGGGVTDAAKGLLWGKK